MINYSEIIENDNLVEVVFNNRQLELINLLKRSILTKVESYAIEYVSFDVNTSQRIDEILAHRFGLLVINNQKYIHSELPVHVYVKGPYSFTTDDISEIPFTYKTPICELKKNQVIDCYLYIRKGKGEDHVKFKSTSSLRIEEDKNKNYVLKFKNIGLLSSKEIIEQGIKAMPETNKRSKIFNNLTI